MADLKLGLDVAFYAYPVGLFATLFAGQLVAYRYRRRPDSAPAALDPKTADSLRSLYARLIYLVQLLLVPALLASVILAVANAVHDDQHLPAGRALFPYSAYLASHVAVLLYFLAGLLPDPDGPWTPTPAHAAAWLVAVLLEVTINAVLFVQARHVPLPDSLIRTLFVLGMARAGLLCLMIALIAHWRYRQRPEKAIAHDETESLLENGTKAAKTNGYGATNGNVNGTLPAPGKNRDAQSSGWFDYFAGFKVLFPYLWYVLCLFFSCGQQ